MQGVPHRKAPGEPPLLFAAPASDPDSGILIPIGQALRGAACNAVCPACGEQVIARQGDERMHSFAHASGKSCAGGAETALHRFAKEVIAKAGRLMLPAYVHEHRGLRETLARAGWFEFERLEFEVRMTGIRPDLIGIKRDAHGLEHRLLIEIHVTNKVDPKKLARIRETGQSAIEIDLSHLDRFADPETLASAILSAAPRDWLHHAKIPQAIEKLTHEADRIIAAREAATRRMAQRLLDAAAGSKTESAETISEVKRLGLDGFIAALPWRHPARETTRSLQSRIVLHCYQTFLKAPDSERIEIPLKTIQKLLEVAGCFPDWLTEDRAAIAQAERADTLFLPPSTLMRQIMEGFIAAKALTMDNHGRIHQDHYVIGEHLARMVDHDRRALRERNHRADEIERLLSRIFSKADIAFRNAFEPDDWKQQTHGDQRTPNQLIHVGGASFDRLREGLSAIAGFLTGSGPEPTELFDLDLASSFSAERNKRAQHAEEERRRQQEAQRQREAEAAAREQELLTELGHIFTIHLPDWIATPIADHRKVSWPMGEDRKPLWIRLEGIAAGESLAAAARANDHGLARALNAVARAQRVIDGVQGWRRKLEEDARRAFRDERHAAMFLTTSHPKLDGRARPLDHVVNEKTYLECVALLPNR